MRKLIRPFLPVILFLTGFYVPVFAGHYPEIASSPDKFTVTITGRVTSDSTSEPIANHAMMIEIEGMGYASTRYTDLNGEYSDTIADVGSGNTVVVSTLDCHQVVHTQALLIISNLVVINFEICAPPPPDECHALFSFQLDSLNRIPNTFIFTNASTGNPDHFLWQFGDGITSTEMNPQHTFGTSGQFEVCLRVTREVSGITACTDSICHTVTTAVYHDLGGHLFAGEWPINNPVSTGDTGVAYLYRVNGNRVFPIDTSMFTTLGYYTFPQVLPGSYLIKTKLSNGSLHHGQYFPGYPDRHLTWTDASPVIIQDTSCYSSDVYLQPFSALYSGTASIQGDVTFDGPGQGEPVSGAEVILYDSQMNPLLFSTTDVQGRFTFSELEYGNYALVTDYPGKYSRVTGVVLEPPATVSDTIHLNLFDHNVTGIDQTHGPSQASVVLFPNPTENTLMISARFPETPSLMVSVYDLTGQRIFRHQVGIQSGGSVIMLPVGDLMRGIYFIRGETSNGLLLFSEKFVKK